jgi:TonB family protein
MTKPRTRRGFAFFTLLFAIVIASTSVAAQVKKVPTVVAAVAPTYPGIALAVPKGGDVVVEVSIGQAGTVTETAVIAGAAPLRHPAVVAARRWRFAPEDAGQRIRLTFSFRVMPNSTPVEELTPVFKPSYAVEVRRTMPEPVVNYDK